MNKTTGTLESLGLHQKHLCIFGFGGNGKYLLKRLRAFKLEPDFLCDNDSEKQTALFHDIECHPLHKADTPKEETLVVITPSDPKVYEEMAQQAKEAGFMHTMSFADFLLKMKAVSVVSIGFLTTTHCNLNCQNCSYFSNVSQENIIPLDVIKNDLKQLAQVAGDTVNSIPFAGGEPLLHPELLEMLTYARTLFPNTELSIITNGILVMQQQEEFWNCFHENNIVLTVTNYPINVDYEGIRKKCIEKNVIFDTINDYQPLKTSYKFCLDLTGSQEISSTFDKCLNGGSCVNIKEGRLFLCQPVSCIEIFNEAFDQSLELSEKDYLDLYKLTSGQEIMDFIQKPIPFCRYCDVDKRVYDLPWAVTKKSIKEWTL